MTMKRMSRPGVAPGLEIVEAPVDESDLRRVQVLALVLLAPVTIPLGMTTKDRRLAAGAGPDPLRRTAAVLLRR